VKLQEQVTDFEKAGIDVVAMTYDAPELQQTFIDKYNITFPLLSDIEAISVKTLGILNTEYELGHSAYGIPHPGVYVVNPDMMIVGKLFIEDYSTRVDASGVLTYALETLPHSE
jgi:peroxiredoxin